MQRYINAATTTDALMVVLGCHAEAEILSVNYQGLMLALPEVEEEPAP